MDRLISQFEVIRAIEKYVNNIFTKNMGDLINDIKAIQSAEPKTGHWILGICDNCGYDWGKDAPIASVPNFCPNCGARMFELQKSEE